MEEFTAVCICGRRVVLRLGPEAHVRQCPNCGASVRIPASSMEEENSLSGFEAPEHASDIPHEVSLFFDHEDEIDPESPSETTKPDPVATSPPKEPSCTRCGRAFRGEWDEIETENGVFCHVCANLAFEKTVKKETAPLVEKTDVSKAMKPSGWDIFDQKQVREEKNARKGAPPKWEMITLAVVATITLLTIYFWPQSTDTTPAPPTKIEMSGLTLIFVYSLMALFNFSATATTIYLTLDQTSRLDPGGLRANLSSVLWGALLLSLVWLGCSMIPLPLVPFIIAIYVSICILGNLYGLHGMDFAYYMVFGMIVHLLFWALRVLIFGMIGLTLS